MNRTERFYLIDQRLSGGASVSLRDFLDELGVSKATFKRDIEYLRDRFHAPIVWDRDTQGYRFARQPATGPVYELPGSWFTASEVYSLLAAQKILAEIEPGILAQRITPLQARLAALLEETGHTAAQVHERVKLVTVGRRHLEPKHFSAVAVALLERQRIKVTAYGRERGEHTDRVLSPQRLVHYRDNWYLEAWCHLREALRTFSVESINAISVLALPAIEVSEAELQAYFAGAYGIFAGPPRATAVLRFTPERARWIETETWHPDQQGERQADGSYLLSIPYSDPRELLMDVLRHGGDVRVEGPEELRSLVRFEAEQIINANRVQ